MKRLLAGILPVLGAVRHRQAGLAADRARRRACGNAKAPDNAEILVMFHLPAPHYRADNYGSANYRDDAGRAARRLAAAVAKDYQLELMEDWAMPALSVDCYRMRLPAGSRRPGAGSAGARQPRRVGASDPGLHAQAGSDPLYRMQPAAGTWHLDEVRKAATGRKVTVAVVDSGIESNHPDLAGQVAVEENFVDGQKYVAGTARHRGRRRDRRARRQRRRHRRRGAGRAPAGPCAPAGRRQRHALQQLHAGQGHQLCAAERRAGDQPQFVRPAGPAAAAVG
jgi:subtilisin family serine protease